MAAAPAYSRRDVLDLVRQYWGFDTLRPIQEDAIRAALRGQDSLVVMPTGGGKSLCFQVPPLVTGQLAIVVSPLIALMKDQVDGLRLAGYPAAAINSGLSEAHARETLAQLDAGELRLLFLAPERLLTPGMLSRLARHADRAEGSLSFAIDEAHCISQWGHDFRPEYRRLAELRETFPRASFHAFTATATKQVQDDIIQQLRLRDAAILVGAFDRPNLTYRIMARTRLDEQCAQIIERHREAHRRAGGQMQFPGATIVYCISRKNTEDLAAALRAKGIVAEPYHAGLDAKTRRQVQDDFATEGLDVVVATVAFGMGIDRSNVRCVIHAAMPKSVEHFQQETGRAGRDGLPAECILLYSAGDAARWRQVLTTAAAETGSEEGLQIQLDLLARMQRFASGAACRHRALADYFGQPYAPPAESKQGCGACDVCLNERTEAADSTTIARKILSCVARVNQAGTPFGAAHIANILRGRDTQKILDYRHHQLSTFGLLRDTPRHAILSYIDQLVAMGALAQGGEFPVLGLTERSVAVLKGQEPVALVEPAGGRADAERARERPGRGERQAASPAAALSDEDAALFDALRRFRYQLAHSFQEVQAR